MTKHLIERMERSCAGLDAAARRERAGRLAGFVGISSNLILFVIKLLAGLLSGSIAIMADAVNNLSDCASSLITLLAFRLSAEPADSEHPYGHARYEYIGGLLVSCIIIVIGFQFLISSVKKIISPEPVLFSSAVAIVLAVSILVKAWQGRFNYSLGRRIDSTALIATAADSRNDALTTSAVLLSAIAAHLTGWNLDGIMGALVALFILYSGVGLIREALNPLLGAAPDGALVVEIGRKIMSYESVLGFHDLMVHNYGPDRRFASVHVEVPASQDILVSHDIIDNIERDFVADLNISLVIHLDPVITDDPRLDALREQVTAITGEIDPAVSFHDFRMVEGQSHTNLIFDVVVPPRYPMKDSALRARYAKEVASRLGPGYYCVITVDRSYISD